MMARSPLCTRLAAIGIVVGVFIFTTADAQAQARPNCEEIRITGRPAFDLYLKCVVSQLSPLDPKRREWFGEHYDPKKYYECRKDLDFFDMRCEKYRLVRRPEPEYWPYEGKVPPVKWPDPPAQSVYRKGMTAKQYFDALCKAEAGEFIYKTVDNVEGIYQIRPRNRASDYELRDRYVMEDPYGYTTAEARNAPTIFVNPPVAMYKFFERPKIDSPSSKWATVVERHSGYFSNRVEGALIHQPMVVEEDNKPKSRYGYTWRGIRRPHDRENNIAGGELMIVDLSTNEVLGIRRGFIHVQVSPQKDYSVNWDHWYVCPRYQERAGAGKDVDFVYWFIGKVLRK